MTLTRTQEVHLSRILRKLCAEGFIDEAKELSKLPDEELASRLFRLRGLADRLADRVALSPEDRAALGA